MKKLVGVCFVMMVLTSCNKQSGTDDLRLFISNAFKDRKPEIVPLPALKPIEVFIYQASNYKDPFDTTNLNPQVPVEADIISGERGPDLARGKELLENYSMDALNLVGIMQQHGIDWAIIRVPDKTVHRVTTGNYLGHNDGEIISIKGNGIIVQELLKDSTGRWEKQLKNLKLLE